jgi:hypothetical protein
MSVISKIYIHSPGDPSVGIFPQTLVIQQDGAPDGWVFDIGGIADEDQAQEREHVRAQLKKVFADLMDDGGVTVWFDNEPEFDEPEAPPCV